MALYLESTTSQGIPFNYWKIGDICRNLTIKMTNITLYGYYNQEARQADKNPVYTNTFTCQPQDFDSYFSLDILNQVDVNDLSQGYKFLKEKTEMFANAQDVLEV